ncbi:MAG: hypothetical protein ACLR78_07145 [Roseburia sp.]
MLCFEMRICGWGLQILGHSAFHLEMLYSHSLRILQTLSKPPFSETPNGLPGIPVSSGGNYTDERGQQWVADERLTLQKGERDARIEDWTGLLVRKSGFPVGRKQPSRRRSQAFIGILKIR